MSGEQPTSAGRLLLEEWLSRYDAALLRGETPPDLADVEGPEAEALRDFLDRMDRTLGPRVSRGRSGPASSGSAGGRATGMLPFESIGRFLIEEELGRGGFGIVFRAFDPTIGRRVAVKVPRGDALTEPDVRRRFLQEAHAAAQLDHPNLVPVFEVGEADRVCYIASAYCEGPTLRRWIDDGHAPVDPQSAARLILRMTRAIEYMHARGILHCDLKPGNVLLAPPPAGDPRGEPTPRVTDFGLARLADAPVGDSTAPRAWGTPPYMAPEQIEMRREAIGPATDVYALGAMLYELLTGRKLHRGETTWELMRAVVAEPPAPPRGLRPSIPRDLAAIATRCLEKRPDRRYPDAAALADDLVRYLDRRPTRARPLGRARRLARWSSRNRAAAALLLMGAAMLVVSVSHALALRWAVDELNRANAEKQTALDRAERQEALTRDALAREEAKGEEQRAAHYAAILALAQQETGEGRPIQAQRLLRNLIPGAESGEPDLRDFAWRWLWRQSRRECTVLDDLAPAGECFVAASDGLAIASASGRGGTWRVGRSRASGAPAPDWPGSTFKPLPEAGGLPWRVALAGDFLAMTYSAGGKRGLSVLDARDGRFLETLGNLGLHAGGIAATADFRRLAVGAPAEPAGRLVEWELDLGDRRTSVLGVPAAAAAAFTGDGGRIAVLKMAEPPPFQRAFEIWGVRSGLREVASGGPVGPALAASPIPKGPIATGTMDGVVQIRDPERGEILYTLSASLPEADRVDCAAFSPDGKLLAAGYNGLAILWDLEGGREIARIDRLTNWADSIAFLGGSTGDVLIGLSNGMVLVWHTEPIAQPEVLDAHDDEVWGVGFVDDGRTLVTMGGDRALKLWDPATGEALKTMSGQVGWPSCLATSASGGLAATGDFDGEVLIWDLAEGKLLHRLKAQEDRVRAVAFSPDGKTLASAGRAPLARLWDVATGGPAGTIDVGVADVRGLAFRPDGRMLASGGEDGLVRLWDVEERRERLRLDASAHVSCVAWTPDGRTLVTGDVWGTVTLWDVGRGEARVRLANLHRREVSGLAVSPDGRTLATAGQDNLIRLIDVATGLRHLTLPGHAAGVNAVAFSPDGRVLASASHDHAVRLWWAGPSPASPLPSPPAGL